MKMSKKIRLLLSLTAILVCFGCNVVRANDLGFLPQEEMETTIDDVTFYANGAITLTEIKQMAESYAYNLSELSKYTPEEIEYLVENTSGTDVYEEFAEIYGKDGIGTYAGYDNLVIEEKKDNELVIAFDMHFTEVNYTLKLDVVVYPNIRQIVKNHEFVVIDSANGDKVSNKTDEDKLSTTDKLLEAAQNTLLGMGTVFVVLILISLIISCFSFIPKIQVAFSKKNKEEPVIIESKANEQTVVTETVDDTELIAVIAAAIAASENTTTDGFVVRSIRRRISR